MKTKERNAYMHEVDLGTPLQDTEQIHLIAGHGKDPVVLAILQKLRNRVAEVDRAGRQVPSSEISDPGDYRAYHDGGADALEEIFWDILRDTQTELDKELEDGS